ncbi:MAG: urea carboxylase-associated family protein [Alphaproteobacteria bacterium]|nr:urea carboxylase-associated family protein [Alphaproteobacteria bacterium]
MTPMGTIKATIHVPARTGRGFAVDRGDLVRITDLQGAQPVDFWAFNRDNVTEYLSCEHTKPSIERLYPRRGDAAYTNHRRPIVRMLEDNSPGQHDMQFAACDRYRYLELGAKLPHASCTDNLHLALDGLDIRVGFTPQPWNLFTNFFLNPDGSFTVKAPETKPGDNIILRAEMDAYIIVSACPQDMNATCGGVPTDIQVEVGRPA